MESSDFVWTADSFGGVVQKAREAKGLTQQKLAEGCGISAMYVSQIEHGQRIPKLGICRALAQALALDERRLLLLAHRASIPKEIYDLLMDNASADDEEQLSEQLSKILKLADGLPEPYKTHLAKVWEQEVKFMCENLLMTK